MTTIKIYKQSKILSSLHFVILSTLLIASLPEFVENIKFGGSSFGYFSFPLFFVATSFAYYNLYFTKSFISWNKDLMIYRLPIETNVTQIKIDTIKSVEVKLFEIQLITKDNSLKVLEFQSLNDKELEVIKNKFKEIRDNLYFK